LKELRSNVKSNVDSSNVISESSFSSSATKSRIHNNNHPSSSTDNVRTCNGKNVAVSQLRWGRHGDIDSIPKKWFSRFSINSTFFAKDGNEIDTTMAQHIDDRRDDNDDDFIGLDVIMGSDIIYTEEVLEPLFDTVVQLMMISSSNKEEDGEKELSPSSLFLLAYTRRNVSIDLVLECAKRHNLSWILESSPSLFGKKKEEEESKKEGVFVFFIKREKEKL